MENLVGQIFSKKWSALLDTQNKSLAQLNDSTLICPGVYVIAYSKNITQDQEIELDDVFYVGMSNAAKGVKGRLKQFVDAIQGEGMHSGGQRFRKDYANMQPFYSFSRVNNGERFYYAHLAISCQVAKSRRTAKDLQRMGEVACLEYYVLAHLNHHRLRSRWVEELGWKPEVTLKRCSPRRFACEHRSGC